MQQGSEFLAIAGAHPTLAELDARADAVQR